MSVTKPALKSAATLLIALTLLFSACKEQSQDYVYSIDDAREHMQHHNWDSAKYHAVNVLAWANEAKDISLANAIISMANDNLILDEKELEEQWSHAFRNMRLSYEAKEDITWIYDPSTTQVTNKNSFHLYMGNRDRKFWLQFRVQYRGLRELSMLGYTVNTDNNSYTFSPNEKIHKGREERVVWEWFDQAYSENEEEMIADILSSREAKLILIGSNGNHERFISEEEKTAMRNILKAYEITPKHKAEKLETQELENMAAR